MRGTTGVDRLCVTSTSERSSNQYQHGPTIIVIVPRTSNLVYFQIQALPNNHNHFTVNKPGKIQRRLIANPTQLPAIKTTIVRVTGLFSRIMVTAKCIGSTVPTGSHLIGFRVTDMVRVRGLEIGFRVSIRVRA